MMQMVLMSVSLEDHTYTGVQSYILIHITNKIQAIHAVDGYINKTNTTLPQH